MPDLASAVHAVARLARQLECSCGRLTLAQYRVLAMVNRGDEQASRLAGRLAVAPPTLTAAVDGLVDRGLLRRSEVSGDRRATRICMTPLGRAALQAAERGMAERLETLLGRVDDRDAVLAALAGLGSALDVVAAERAVAGR